MRTRRVQIVMALLMCFVIFSSVAYAGATVDDSTLARVQFLVDRTNESIDRDITRTTQLCDYLESLPIDAIIRDKLIEKQIYSLVRITNAKANATMQAASAMGVEVECEWVEYEIGGQLVLIDPLYIVSD